MLPVEELLTIEQETLHEAPVHIDLSVLIDFRSGQLLYKRVQHRAFGYLEGRGIVDEGIALVIELHFGGDYLHLVQRNAFLGHSQSAHRHIANLNSTLTLAQFKCQILVRGLVVGM